ncbi:MAG TPA: VOC family protein [Candidatus Kapabacteria bacterium]|nr:VOC family protein [Candidatus Kapabacteria bacterium]
MQVHAYLNFDGTCREAFTFYERVLGGRINAMMTHAGSPAEAHVSPEWADKILHANMTIGDTLLMASDAPPGHYQKPAGFAVSLQVKEPADAERIFGALAENGTVSMPIQQTFWAARFGMLTDQYGIPWMINCDQAA